MAEMATFCVLVIPLPYNVRKKLVTFLSENPLVAKACSQPIRSTWYILLMNIGV